MKGIKLLLALTTLAGMAQAAEPTYTWWNGTAKEMNVTASTNGTWTIGMNINVEALKNLPKGTPMSNGNTDYSKTGNPLFSVQGSGYDSRSNGWWDALFPSRQEYTNRNMTVTMGWGGNWYTNLEAIGAANNSVAEGLQIGVTSTKDRYNLSGGGISSDGFNVYCFDTKIQNDGVHGGDNGTYDWSISEEVKATVTTLDDIAKMDNIEQATMFIVHTYANGPDDQLADNTHRDYASDSGTVRSGITYTTLYLTIILNELDANGNKKTINFMAQYDDDPTLGVDEGTAAGGSNWYDVDFVTKINDFNTGLIEDTDFVFINSALTSAQREALMNNGLPEPTTATMSLLALAALAARRRRRAVASK